MLFPQSVAEASIPVKYLELEERVTAAQTKMDPTTGAGDERMQALAPEAQSPNQTTEYHLMHEFNSLMAALKLPDLMVPVAGRPIAHPELFRLTAIENHYSDTSLSRGGYSSSADSSVQIHDAPPYLDTRQAIGLVYEDYLIAVGGAGIDAHGRIFIRQLQDITGIHKDQGRAYYKTGLHNGFYWRDTLVRCWEEIGAGLGCPAVIIQSDNNNEWDTVRNAGGHAYDNTARRLGYSQIEYGDWQKVLPVHPDAPNGGDRCNVI